MDLKKYFTSLSTYGDGTTIANGASFAKIIATFCVVLTHSYKIFNYMSIDDSEIFYLRGFHAFASCGVAVFFLLSGYFMTFIEGWDYKKNLRIKFRSLVIPYLLFISLYAFISCTGSLIFPQFFEDFRTFTLYDWMMHIVGIPFVVAPKFYGPLWFVRELIIFNMLSVFLVPVVKKIPGYILVAAVSIFYFLPIAQVTRYSISFFLLGMYLGFKKVIPVLKKPLYIFVFMIIGFIVPTVFEGKLAWKISILFMVCIILSVSEILIRRKSVEKFTQIAMPFSFPIYLLHEYPITTLMRILDMIHISLSKAIVAFFVDPFVIIIVCVVIIILWKKLSPKSFSLFTGGR